MATVELPEGMLFLFSNKKRPSGSVMFSNHYHDNKFEIYYMVSGKCSYFIDDKTYEVIPGDVVLIPEGAIHKTHYSKEENARILIECSGHFIPDDIRDRLPSLLYVYRNPAMTREIHGLLKRIEDEYNNPDEFTADALKAHMRLLFYLLIRNKNTAEKTTKNALVEDVVAYIKENYSSDIRLTGMAKAHFVSSEHLSRTFRRETGFGFNEYLTLVRLQHAEYMLKERDGRSISEIAYSCGFNDSNYFSDKFKRAYGISPLKYSKEFG